MAETTSSSPENAQRRDALEHSQAAWHAAGQRLRSITPSELGRSLLTLGIIAFLIWLVVSSWPALVPFLIGGVFAYILLPFVNFLDRFMPRSFATAIGLVVAIGAIVLFVAQIIPVVSAEATRLAETIPSLDDVRSEVDQIDAWILTLPKSTQNVVNDVLVQLEQRMTTNYDQFLNKLIDTTIQGVITLVNTISFALGFVVLPGWMFTVLVDQQRGQQELDKMLPKTIRGDTWAVVRILDRTFRAFVQSQLVQAVITGVGVYVGLALIESAFGVTYQYKVLFAIVVAFFQLIPEIGPVLGGVLAVLLALFNSTEAAAGVLISIVAVQVLVKQLVAPRLERRFVNLHPALIVIAIVALSEFGILWIIVAAPIVVIVRDLLSYIYGRIGDPPKPAGVLPRESADNTNRASLLTASATVAPQPNVPAVYRRGRSARAVQQARTQTALQSNYDSAEI